MGEVAEGGGAFGAVEGVGDVRVEGGVEVCVGGAGEGGEARGGVNGSEVGAEEGEDFLVFGGC